MIESPENTEPDSADAFPPISEESLMQVEVTLKFNVGSSKTTLKDLSSIRPGFVFETDAPTSQPVTIELNGARLGKGELVAVGDRIGVRVTEFRSNE